MSSPGLPPTGRAEWNDDTDRAAELREQIEAAANRGDFDELARLLALAEGTTTTTTTEGHQP
jgi:hypothetical protein